MHPHLVRRIYGTSYHCEHLTRSPIRLDRFRYCPHYSETSEDDAYSTAYTLCSTAFVPLSGSLAEVYTSYNNQYLGGSSETQIFGRKILMSGSIVIFAVGSALCGAANSLNFLIAGRGTHLNSPV
jgi:hypothetical protein